MQKYRQNTGFPPCIKEKIISNIGEDKVTFETAKQFVTCLEKSNKAVWFGSLAKAKSTFSLTAFGTDSPSTPSFTESLPKTDLKTTKQ